MRKVPNKLVATVHPEPRGATGGTIWLADAETGKRVAHLDVMFWNEPVRLIDDDDRSWLRELVKTIAAKVQQ